MRTFLRHQVGSVITTVVDFSVMILFVSVVGLKPAFGTACGAFAGAITNFTLGRTWIFQAQPDHPGRQALRYALVSGTSLLLNSLGEYLVATVLGVQYVAARAAVAILVSVGWNFPMQKYFVFSLRPAEGGRHPEGASK